MYMVNRKAKLYVLFQPLLDFHVGTIFPKLIALASKACATGDISYMSTST